MAADVTITATAMVEGTPTADLVGSGTAVNSGQTFTCNISGMTRNIMLIVEEVGGGAATITLDAGIEPPSERSGLGGDTITLAASDLKAYIYESGQFVNASGYINGSVATNNCKIRVLQFPVGH